MLIKKRHVGFINNNKKKTERHVCRVHKRNKWIKKDKRESESSIKDKYGIIFKYLIEWNYGRSDLRSTLQPLTWGHN